MDKLNLMADALIKYETIDSEQIDEIMAGKAPQPPKDWDDSDSTSGTGTAEAPTTGKDSPEGTIGGPAKQH